ncbi:MAG: DUF1254 domain-containing protein [Hyphomonadaceae bacterium]|nr:DUF1254 domain-containing protein [Hyphomonadaceae bacterium]
MPTPNADVIYSMSHFDLKETGPLVVAAPPDVIGMFTDFFQRTITDVGLIGPDRARGGLYLLLPPDHAGEVPQGYFAFKSKTYNVLLFFRTIMAKGENGPNPKPAVALAEQTRVYPLWAMEKDVQPMQLPNGSGKRINMMYPVDNTFWTKLKAFVDYEPVSSLSMRIDRYSISRMRRTSAPSYGCFFAFVLRINGHATERTQGHFQRHRLCEQARVASSGQAPV